MILGRASRAAPSFTIVEVILALGLFTLIVVGGVSAAARAFSANRLGEEESSANFLASEGIEAVRAIAAKDYAGLSDGSYGLDFTTGSWRFQGSSDVTDNKYTRRAVISSVFREADGDVVASGGQLDLFTKRITVNVGWDFSPGRTNTVSAASYVTHWVESICSWDSAGVVETVDLAGTADATSIVVDGNYAYIVLYS